MLPVDTEIDRKMGKYSHNSQNALKTAENGQKRRISNLSFIGLVFSTPKESPVGYYSLSFRSENTESWNSPKCCNGPVFIVIFVSRISDSIPVSGICLPHSSGGLSPGGVFLLSRSTYLRCAIWPPKIPGGGSLLLRSTNLPNSGGLSLEGK